MNGRVLLDTNIIIALFGKDASVLTNLSNVNEVFIPGIALGELYYGAHKSKEVEANILRINNFAAHSSVLACDSISAKYYGRIKNSLRIKGKPIPENDIWIAALAEQYNLVIITRDEHFKEVETIATETW